MPAAQTSAPLEQAVEHATRNVPTAMPDDHAGAVRAALVGRRFDTAADIAVLDDGRFVGLVSAENLIVAPADRPMSELMEPDPPVVAPHTDQEIAAHQLIRSGNTSLAVVDDAGTFYGLVTPRRMLEVLAQEHREDLARLGGNVEGAGVARQAAFEPVRRRLVHRLPWLLVGLVGAMASAVIVGAFEAQLETKVLLAFFIPGLVYMADAIGTQTETVIIRGLSVGVSVRRVAFRELVTGLAVGAVVAAAFVLFALLVWGDATVAVTVALALLASCSIATAVAMTLPWLLQRAGVDPAFGSGPLATVIQDLLTIAIYFAIAVPLAT